MAIGWTTVQAARLAELDRIARTAISGENYFEWLKLTLASPDKSLEQKKVAAGRWVTVLEGKIRFVANKVSFLNRTPPSLRSGDAASWSLPHLEQELQALQAERDSVKAFAQGVTDQQAATAKAQREQEIREQTMQLEARLAGIATTFALPRSAPTPAPSIATATPAVAPTASRQAPRPSVSMAATTATGAAAQTAAPEWGVWVLVAAVAGLWLFLR